DVTAEAHPRPFVRLELHPENLGLEIAAREKPDPVRRKVDRRIVAVGGFVADAKLHEARLGQAVTFSHPPGGIFFLHAEVRPLISDSDLKDCSGGNSRPSCPSGVGGGTFWG